MKSEDEYVVRFNLIERIQHIILFVSLIMLLITGLSLTYHDSWIGRLVLGLEGGLEGRGMLHNIFAFILLALCIFHVFYVTFSDKGHDEISHLKFRRKDFRKFISSLKFSTGLSNEKPRDGRYSFSQKFQYWGVVLGCAVMIVTGLILLLKVWGVAMIVPKWMWDITNIVHSNEGILIFIVLFVWHIYDVHLSPKIFPMNKVWFTGRISKEELRNEHVEEYEKIFGKEFAPDKK